jgi:hypothetical protein
LYFAANIIRGIKSREIRWAWRVAFMGERRGAYRVLVGKVVGKRPYGRPRGGGRIIHWILKKSVGGAWIDPFWFRTGTLGVLVSVMMNLRAP